MPRAAATAHYEDRFLLLAPRPFAIVDGTRDVVDGTRELGYKDAESWLLKVVRAAYEIEGAGRSFEFIATPGGHEYHLEPATSFLHRHLLRSNATATVSSESPTAYVHEAAREGAG